MGTSIEVTDGRTSALIRSLGTMTYGDTALSRPVAATKVLYRGLVDDRLVIALIYESQCGGGVGKSNVRIGIAPLLFLKGLLVAVYSLACHVISGALIRQP